MPAKQYKGFGFESHRRTTDHRGVVRLGEFAGYEHPLQVNAGSELSEIERVQQTMDQSEKCGGGRRIIRKQIGGE